MKKAYLASVILIGLSSTAHADIRINGFANLVAGVTSSDDSLYEFDEDINFATGSLFALQVSGDINEQITATAQLIARGDDDFQVDFEWAYFTYAASDDLSVSVGRFRAPLFRYSSSLDVGYSYHWIAPPQVVYDVVFNNIDGIRLDYSDYAGDFEYSLQAVFGNFEAPDGGGVVTGDNTLIVTGEVAYESFKARAVYGVADKVDFDLPALNAAITQVSAGSDALENFLLAEDDKAEFIGFGLEYDNFTYFISGEYTITKLEESFFSTEDAFYITAGVRLGKWTPSLTYENFDNMNPFKGAEFINQLPPPFIAPVTGGVNALQSTFRNDTTTYTATIRYDLKANIALKADVSRFDSDIRDNEDATLYRFAVNYVF